MIGNLDKDILCPRACDGHMLLPFYIYITFLMYKCRACNMALDVIWLIRLQRWCSKKKVPFFSSQNIVMDMSLLSDWLTEEIVSSHGSDPN